MSVGEEVSEFEVDLYKIDGDAAIEAAVGKRTEDDRPPKPDVEVGVEWVSLDAATEWNKTIAPAQRPKRKRQIEAYAKDMSEGRWEVGAGTIVFDVNGNLVNGQHTIAALIQSEVSGIWTVVVRNVSLTVYDKFDSGLRRTATDALNTAGLVNAQAIVRAVAILQRYEEIDPDKKKRLPSAPPCTTAQIHAFVDEHPRLKDLSPQIVGTSHVCPYPGSLLAALYLIDEKDRAAASEFFGRFKSGIELKADDPRLVLGRALLAIKDGKGKQGPSKRADVAFATILRAWNLWRNERVATVGNLLRAKDEIVTSLD